MNWTASESADSEFADQRRPRLGRLLGTLVVLEIAATTPLYFYLPTSKTALVASAALLGAMNAVILARNSANRLNRALLIGNGITVGAGLMVSLATIDGRSRTTAVAALGTVFLASALAGTFGVKERVLRQCLFAQMLALSSILSCWILTRVLSDGTGLDVSGALQTHLRFAFVMPLGLVTVCYSAARGGWKVQQIALGIAVVLQYGMQLDAVAGALGRESVLLVGIFVLVPSAFLWVIALIPGSRRNPGELAEL
jgi:hypothetical protein